MNTLINPCFSFLTLLLMCVTTSAYGAFALNDPHTVEEVIEMYNDRDIKVPKENQFTTLYRTTYFSSREVGNKDNTGLSFYLANGAFWWTMDNIREATGVMVLSSTYRDPEYNDEIDPPGAERSMHQYGGAADISAVWGVAWSAMTEAQKIKVRDAIQEAEIALKAEYGDSYYLYKKEKSDHVHVHIMNYCSFPDNYD